MMQICKTTAKTQLRAGHVADDLLAVLGGVSWPGAHQGYALVAGLSATANKIYVIGEMSCWMTPDLAKAMAEATRAQHVEAWLHEGGLIGDHYRTQINREARQKRLTKPTAHGDHETIPLSQAPFADNAPFLAGLLRGALMGERLVLLDDAARGRLPVLRGQLDRQSAMRPADLADEMCGQMFALRALAYVCARADQLFAPPANNLVLEVEPADSRTGV